ncbi:hypothetical protein ACFJGW_00535 [Burkholderiaceae bacterium UC74_6]
MTIGLRLKNPSGELVLDADVPGFRYLSRPSPSVNGSIATSGGTPSQLLPYQYVVNTGSDSIPPLAICRPATDRLMRVRDVVALGGGNWRIEVFGCAVSSLAVMTPDIYVFCTMASSGQTWSQRLWDSNGVVTFDMGQKPMWLRGKTSFPAASGEFQLGIGWSSGSDAGFNADNAAPPSGISIPGVIGTPVGSADALSDGDAEPTSYYQYAWCRTSGGNLERRVLWLGTERPSYTGATGYLAYARPAQTFGVVDLSNY